MEVKDRFIGFVLCAIVLTSCNSLSDCEKNFIEGIGISKGAYLTIQDNDKFLTANEVEELLAAMPLNGNTIIERRKIIAYSSRIYNDCSKVKSSNNKNGLAGCYKGELTITDKSYNRTKKSRSQKFSVQEYAAALREKYPQYEGYSDLTIVNAWVEKFPEVKSQIDFGQYARKREDFLKHFREATGTTEEEVSDGAALYNAALMYPELKEVLGIRTEAYEIDWDADAKKKSNTDVPVETSLTLENTIKVDVDLKGYYVIHNENKYYFDDAGEIHLSFKEDLPTWESLKAKVEMVFKFEKNRLVYEQVISTYEYDELKSTKTLSGTLARISSSPEGCN